MDGSLEIRKLSPKAVFGLVQVLEYGKGWKKLMSIIPKHNSDVHFDSKYKSEHIKLIEHAGMSQQRACTEIFLEEWGTSGRQQPNLATLRNLLVKAELFRAAEYVAVNLLQECVPERPALGPAAPVDVSEETVNKLISLKVKEPNLFSTSIKKTISSEDQRTGDALLSSQLDGENIRPIISGIDSRFESEETVSRMFREDSVYGVGEDTVAESDSSSSSDIQPVLNYRVYETQETLPLGQTQTSFSGANGIIEGIAPELNTSLPHFSYCELESCTANFCESPLVSHEGPDRGRKLGTGAFGTVYLGVMASLGQVAVKKLNKDAINVEMQFQNEVESLSRYQHSNLLPLLGYSCDGPAFCLVYQYMSNGSLQERLACQDLSLVLPWLERLAIALGTSKGILHLHTAYKKPLIHRDIKSANILLDHTLQPKLGDFGLVRLGASGQQSQSIALTTTIFGTSAYMAPEAFRGDISVKLDAFSFGVVLLELLTSLPPYDEEREGCDLVTHVDEICEGSIEPLLDTKAGPWESSVVQPSHLYLLASDCLKEKRHRPNMSAIVQQLQALSVSYNG